MKKQIFKGPQGITLELDPEQVFPEDPGQGTPALVCFPNGDTGTYNCVTCEGETADGTPATQEQLDWLMTFEDKIEQLLG